MGLTVYLRPVENSSLDEDAYVYMDGITHNLTRMADEAGIYQFLWRPSEVGVEKASQLIEPLDRGLKLLQSDPERFKQFNAKNGWGTYEHFVEFVSAYRNACMQHPDANVESSA